MHGWAGRCTVMDHGVKNAAALVHGAVPGQAMRRDGIREHGRRQLALAHAFDDGHDTIDLVLTGKRVQQDVVQLDTRGQATWQTSRGACSGNASHEFEYGQRTA